MRTINIVVLVVAFAYFVYAVLKDFMFLGGNNALASGLLVVLLAAISLKPHHAAIKYFGYFVLGTAGTYGLGFVFPFLDKVFLVISPLIGMAAALCIFLLKVQSRLLLWSVYVLIALTIASMQQLFPAAMLLAWGIEKFFQKKNPEHKPETEKSHRAVVKERAKRVKDLQKEIQITREFLEKSKEARMLRTQAFLEEEELKSEEIEEIEESEDEPRTTYFRKKKAGWKESFYEFIRR